MRHARTTSLSVVAVLTAAVLAGCGSSTPALATGIPDTYPPGVVEGLERFPDIGSTGIEPLGWRCPLESSIVVDGKEHTKGRTMFAQPHEGVYAVECSFYPPLPVSVVYAEAQDDDAYEALVDATRAHEVRGNVQTEKTVVVGEREITVVRFEYPTNPDAGVAYEAHYLDPTTRSRATLEVHDSDERSADYDEQRAAEDLAQVLTH